MLFLHYPPCSTCKKAQAWLDAHDITYTARHIKDENPTYEELKHWYKISGLPLKKFFNTSGLLYKSMELKNKLPGMSEEEQLRLLATDGMLVKRPVIVTEDGKVMTGFREKDWEETLLQDHWKDAMHCVFGTKQDVEYVTRKGAYLIPVRDNRIAVVFTAKGYFLLGGGIVQGESDAEAILRECLEETGCPAIVQKFICSAEAYLDHPVLGNFHPVQRYYLGELHKQEATPTEQGHLLQWIPYQELRGKLYVQMQNWALDMCWNAYHEK